MPNETQSDKFREMARKLECDETENAFAEKLKKAVQPSQNPIVQKLSVKSSQLSAEIDEEEEQLSEAEAAGNSARVKKLKNKIEKLKDQKQKFQAEIDRLKSSS